MEPDGAKPPRCRDEEIAAALMRMALALLERAGDRMLAAARLQHALDTLVPPPAATAEELEAWCSGWPSPKS